MSQAYKIILYGYLWVGKQIVLGKFIFIYVHVYNLKCDITLALYNIFHY